MEGAFYQEGQSSCFVLAVSMRQAEGEILDRNGGARPIGEKKNLRETSSLNVRQLHFAGFRARPHFFDQPHVTIREL